MKKQKTQKTGDKIKTLEDEVVALTATIDVLVGVVASLSARLEHVEMRQDPRNRPNFQDDGYEVKGYGGTE